MWYEERSDKGRHSRNPEFSLCCRGGTVELPLLKEPPDYLNNLLNECEFRDNIRAYNSMFAFTSIGGKIDKNVNRGRGPYCFKLGGQNHHKIGSLKPVVGETPKFSQLYIYDTENEITNRIKTMGKDKIKGPLQTSVVSGLMDMLDNFNVLVKVYRMVRDWCKQYDTQNMKLIIKSSRSADGRWQNMPTVNEIAGLIIGDLEDTILTRDVIVEHRKEGLIRISDLHPSFMAMQYPLLFPYGEDGFRLEIPLNKRGSRNRSKQNSQTNNFNDVEKTRKFVTMKEYCAFRF